MAPTRFDVSVGTGHLSGAVNLVLYVVVLMKASVVSATSCLALASLRNTTFQPGFS